MSFIISNSYKFTLNSETAMCSIEKFHREITIIRLKPSGFDFSIASNCRQTLEYYEFLKPVCTWTKTLPSKKGFVKLPSAVQEWDFQFQTFNFSFKRLRLEKLQCITPHWTATFGFYCLTGDCAMDQLDKRIEKLQKRKQSNLTIRIRVLRGRSNTQVIALISRHTLQC